MKTLLSNKELILKMGELFKEHENLKVKIFKDMELLEEKEKEYIELYIELNNRTGLKEEQPNE
jgi:glutathionylspermidine synthase